MKQRARRGTLVRPDATIHYEVTGPAGAPTVVLLHGSTLDRHSWDRQVEVLRSDYRVVVPDLRGHGESTLEGRFGFDAAVEDVLALLDEVGGERVALVGLSLGGNIAQEVVYRRPDAVEALVVADATCNTAPRGPLEVPMSMGYLAASAVTPRARYLEQAVAGTARGKAGGPDGRRGNTGPSGGRELRKPG